MGAAKVSLWTVLKRYIPSVLFPTFFFGAIYLDYDHTQKWKASKAENIE